MVYVREQKKTGHSESLLLSSLSFHLSSLYSVARSLCLFTILMYSISQYIKHSKRPKQRTRLFTKWKTRPDKQSGSAWRVAVAVQGQQQKKHRRPRYAKQQGDKVWKKKKVRNDEKISRWLCR